VDIFDLMTFVVFGVLLTAAVIVVVELGGLPGKIARDRGHPQAASVNVAGWLGLATLGILWPLALIWAFWKSPFNVAAAANEKAELPAVKKEAGR
jgi:Protein of unknown function (DUF3302)